MVTAREIAKSRMSDLEELKHDLLAVDKSKYIRECYKINDEVVVEIFNKLSKFDDFYCFSVLWDRAREFTKQYDWSYFDAEIDMTWDTYKDLEDDFFHIMEVLHGKGS